MQIFIVLSWCEIFCFRTLSLPQIASKGFFELFLKAIPAEKSWAVRWDFWMMVAP
jgi:hypothetical protein